jgi:hypothetical protein
MYDFEIPRLGFYHIPVLEKKARLNKEVYGGVLTIKKGVANTLVRKELKLYDEKWNWKVT